MKRLFPSRHSLAATVLALTTATALAGYQEDFSTVDEGTLLKDVPGWMVHYPPDATGEGAVCMLNAGYNGRGVRFSSKESFKITLPPAKIVSILEGHPSVKFKIRLIDDAYAAAQVVVGQSDGVNGFSVRFQGGNSQDSRDNTVRISTEGTNWGNGESKTLTEANWKPEVWYEVIISDIVPGASLRGTETKAKLSIREADNPGEFLVKDQEIGAVGTSGKFEFIDAIAIGNSGVRRAFDIDDITVSGDK